ncbi:hypothetical protein COLO4_07918 [Corchorus olitorius]|uniref:Uncharacterized protein n=1 Tax=Corchorus olitorius TaxID=93759 RepID=A0A1R3KI58_9ROSI|nr:hypothetical protein COLO4_07918 [Corchorus olitorius]
MAKRNPSIYVADSRRYVYQNKLCRRQQQYSHSQTSRVNSTRHQTGLIKGGKVKPNVDSSVKALASSKC